MKFLYNGIKAFWIMNCGGDNFSPHHMNPLLVEAWDAFKVYYRKTIGDKISKKKLLPPSLPDITTNSEAYVSSIEVSYVDQSEDTNVI